MSDNKNDSNGDAPEQPWMGRIVDFNDFENLVTAVSGTLEGARENTSDIQELSKAFFQLEKGCTVMYEVIMKQKTTLDELEKRIERLENAQDNPR